MSVASPRASVIIRTKDSARTLPGALASVRAQTVACEVVVVDSGSRDATLSIARAGADRVMQLPAERFSFGRALNVGAGAAGAPIHFALSSHSMPPDEHWIERSLAKYDRAGVAATNGALRAPGSSRPLTATFFQTLADASRYPFWGFSNTGSSWRGPGGGGQDGRGAGGGRGEISGGGGSLKKKKKIVRRGVYVQGRALGTGGEALVDSGMAGIRCGARASGRR